MMHCAKVAQEEQITGHGEWFSWEREANKYVKAFEKMLFYERRKGLNGPSVNMPIQMLHK